MEIPEEYKRKDYIIIRGIPMVYSCADNWERVDQFQFRSDDLVLASYPKSGTTWMSEILDLILHNGDVEKCQRDAIYNRVIMMEFACSTSFPPGTELLASMPSPRLLRTHLPIQLLPKSFWESKCKIPAKTPGRQSHDAAKETIADLLYSSTQQCSNSICIEKVIYVARNAKDAAVSSYHFSLANTLLPHPGTWAQFLKDFMSGNVSFGSWYEHVKDWWDKRNELQLLYLFYEDMKEDLKGEIQKLLAFLQKDLEEEVLEKIVHQTSFHVMNKNPMANYKTIPNNLFDQTSSSFMRKGICGDWKNHFTVDQNERFDEDYARKMSGSSLSFRTQI